MSAPRSLSAAVDAAVAAENEAFLSDPAAIAAAQAEGDAMRIDLERSAGHEPWSPFPAASRTKCEVCGVYFGRHAQPVIAALDGRRLGLASGVAIAIEASSLGWAPGYWPDVVLVTRGDIERSYSRSHSDERYGDLRSVTYKDLTGTTIEVLND